MEAAILMQEIHLGERHTTKRLELVRQQPQPKCVQMVRNHPHSKYGKIC